MRSKKKRGGGESKIEPAIKKLSDAWKKELHNCKLLDGLGVSVTEGHPALSNKNGPDNPEIQFM